MTNNNNNSDMNDNTDTNTNTLVYPGDLIQLNDILINNIHAGEGTYIKNNLLYSSLLGSVCISEDFSSDKVTKIKTVCVNSHRINNNECDNIIKVGDIVLGRIVKLQMNQAIMDIIAVVKPSKRSQSKVGSNESESTSELLELHVNPRGVVRREDIRLSEVDKLIIGDCFHIGDIVRATVLSLGDSRQYILSTAAAEYGVLWAVNSTNNNIMTPLNWKVSILVLST